MRGGGHEIGQSSLRLWAVKAAAHQIDPGRVSGGGFFRGFDVNVRQAALAFQLLEVKDGEFFAWAKHG